MSDPLERAMGLLAQVREEDAALRQDHQAMRDRVQQMQAEGLATGEQFVSRIAALTCERDKALGQRDRATETVLLLRELTAEIAKRPVALEQAQARIGELEREWSTTQAGFRREEAMRVSLAEQLAVEQKAHEDVVARMSDAHALEVHQLGRRLEQSDARLRDALSQVAAAVARAEAAERHSEQTERATRDHLARTG
jgi:hypothetical protein